MLAATFRTYTRVLNRYNHLSTVITVPCRNAVSPPKLTTDTPITNIIRPVKITFLHAFWQKFDFTIFNSLNSRLNHLIHLNKPLLLDHRLNGRMTAVMNSYIMRMRHHFNQKSFLLKICNQSLAALITVHSGILSGFLIHGCIIVNYDDFL